MKRPPRNSSFQRPQSAPSSRGNSARSVSSLSSKTDKSERQRSAHVDEHRINSGHISPQVNNFIMAPTPSLRLGTPADTPVPRSPIPPPMSPTKPVSAQTERPKTASVIAGNSNGPDPELLLSRSLSEPFGPDKKKRLNKMLNKAGISSGNNKKSHPKPPSPKPQKVYVCFYCQKEFPDSLSLTQHSKAHGDRAPYSCSTCGRMFALYSSLVNHERSHAPDFTMFNCKRCSATFLNEASLKSHVRRHDEGLKTAPDTRPYQCHVCNEWISNEGRS